MTKLVVALAILLPAVTRAADLAPDARRGAELFKSEFCTNCHSVRGEGGTSAPDLAKRLDRSYLPAGVTSLMWNHAPVMWKTIAAQNMPTPSLTPPQAADLFAFFYSVRYFEKPGEAQRGKATFDAKCGTCHSLRSGGAARGTPVDHWQALTDPVVLVQRMWNHAPQMQVAAQKRKSDLPLLSSQEMDDMLVYLQNLPETRHAQLEFALPPKETGAELFKKLGCSDCHKDEAAFERQLGDATLTDIAASMWNHASEMRQPHPQIALDEMRQVVSYVWGQQFFIPKGNVASGKKLFESKNCALCHNDGSSGAPALTRPSEPYSAASMVSVLWRHGPTMLVEMQKKNIPWPAFSQSEMSNLISYLNSRRTP